jgi:hypothetical protein
MPRVKSDKRQNIIVQKDVLDESDGAYWNRSAVEQAFNRTLTL